MAISDTYAFNPDVSDLVEEAYERAGLEMTSGYDIRTARRSLNFLMLEWQNRGINLWTITEETLANTLEVPGTTLEKGVATYDIAMGTIGLLDVILRTNPGVLATQNDFRINRISQPTYSNIPNKLSQGTPLQYHFDRKEIRDFAADADQPSTITFWPVPDEDSKYTVIYWRMKRIADVGSDASNTMGTPDRFLPALVSGLAYQIATKRPEAMVRIPFLKQQYEELFKEAADEDRVKTSARFVPNIQYY